MRKTPRDLRDVPWRAFTRFVGVHEFPFGFRARSIVASLSDPFCGRRDVLPVSILREACCCDDGACLGWVLRYCADGPTYACSKYGRIGPCSSDDAARLAVE